MCQDEAINCPKIPPVPAIPRRWQIPALGTIRAKPELEKVEMRLGIEIDKLTIIKS
jgi:hypothetical protein